MSECVAFYGDSNMDTASLVHYTTLVYNCITHTCKLHYRLLGRQNQFAGHTNQLGRYKQQHKPGIEDSQRILFGGGFQCFESPQGQVISLPLNR